MQVPKSIAKHLRQVAQTREWLPDAITMKGGRGMPGGWALGGEGSGCHPGPCNPPRAAPARPLGDPYLKVSQTRECLWGAVTTKGFIPLGRAVALESQQGSAGGGQSKIFRNCPWCATVQGSRCNKKEPKVKVKCKRGHT